MLVAVLSVFKQNFGRSEQQFQILGFICFETSKFIFCILDTAQPIFLYHSARQSWRFYEKDIFCSCINAVFILYIRPKYGFNAP